MASLPPQKSMLESAVTQGSQLSVSHLTEDSRSAVAGEGASESVRKLPGNSAQGGGPAVPHTRPCCEHLPTLSALSGQRRTPVLPASGLAERAAGRGPAPQSSAGTEPSVAVGTSRGRRRASGSPHGPRQAGLGGGGGCHVCAGKEAFWTPRESWVLVSRTRGTHPPEETPSV